jgi:hypothetical protein
MSQHRLIIDMLRVNTMGVYQYGAALFLTLMFPANGFY